MSLDYLRPFPLSSRDELGQNESGRRILKASGLELTPRMVPGTFSQWRGCDRGIHGCEVQHGAFCTAPPAALRTCGPSCVRHRDRRRADGHLLRPLLRLLRGRWLLLAQVVGLRRTCSLSYSDRAGRLDGKSDRRVPPGRTKLSQVGGRGGTRSWARVRECPRAHGSARRYRFCAMALSLEINDDLLILWGTLIERR